LEAQPLREAPPGGAIARPVRRSLPECRFPGLGWPLRCDHRSPGSEGHPPQGGKSGHPV